MKDETWYLNRSFRDREWNCAKDRGTTHAAGPGVIVDNGRITLDPAVFSKQITTLDSAGDVGWFTSLAIGVDGLGLISYHDNTNSDLKVVHLPYGL